MKKLRKKDIYMAELATGKTYREIAEAYGVSWQAVHFACTSNVTKRPRTCLWPHLADWMEDNEVGVVELAEKTETSRQTMYAWFSGKSNPHKVWIDKVLEVTGLSYEYLFAEE